ncbi:MAG: hypothetical protein Q4E45_00295 [Eubacteriales bacterium]|nr:hypothetical protein [Eubacteriales bacterium]
MSSGFLIALALSLMLPGCAKQEPAVQVGPMSEAVPIALGNVAEGRELYCLADSQEEAEKLAELYGIELVEFSNGVATFHAEEDPQTVITRGKDNGWPLLSLNVVEQLTDPVRPSPDLKKQP